MGLHLDKNNYKCLQSIIAHFFADCIQLQISFIHDDQSALQPLIDVKLWMGANFLKLNKAKTEIKVFRKSSKVFSTHA